jgi:hypothetical protein
MNTANINKPVLIAIAISHYCEKVRWAMDYLATLAEAPRLYPIGSAWDECQRINVLYFYSKLNLL